MFYFDCKYMHKYRTTQIFFNVFSLFLIILAFFLLYYSIYLYFCEQKQQKTAIMGIGTYWARKDDQTGDLKTVKPWEEEVSNGDKFFPDPDQDQQKEEEGEV